MKVKGAKKIVNGAPLARNRFRRIGMLAGGTGVGVYSLKPVVAELLGSSVLSCLQQQREHKLFGRLAGARLRDLHCALA